MRGYRPDADQDAGHPD